MDKSKLYRSIPKVDVLLADEEIQGLVEAYSRETVMEAIRSETDALRPLSGPARMRRRPGRRQRASKRILKTGSELSTRPI